jgi:hypothetical protein
MTSSIYLAAAFRHRYRMQGIRADIQRIPGLMCTSRWIDNETDDERDALKSARIDLEDIELADTLIGFPDPARSVNSRGGHFYEEGYSHAMGHRVIIIQNRSHVFHQLHEFYPTWGECLDVLRREAERPAQRMAA